MDRATYRRRSGVIPRAPRNAQRCGGSHPLSESGPDTVFAGHIGERAKDDATSRNDVLDWVTRQLCWEHHLNTLHAAAEASRLWRRAG